MLRQLVTLFALFFSFGLLSLGYGGLAGLTVQQGEQLEFSEAFVGALVSASYLGFIVGGYLFKYLLPKISYIRTFAVCSALLAVFVLFLPILEYKTSWLILRFLIGLFFSTNVVICEGWLGVTARDEHRSRLHAVFVMVSYVAYSMSQYILIVGEKWPIIAFSIAAIFFSLSLLPICLTRFSEPQTALQSEEEENRKPLSLIHSYWISPIAFVGQFAVGLVMSSTWLFVSYSNHITDDVAASAQLASLFFISGVFLQLPIGWIADKISDRRYVMIAVYNICALSGIMLFFGELLTFDIIKILIFIFGGFSATMFSVNLAYGQSFIGRDRIPEYNVRLYQSYAVGALLGPLIAGFLMSHFSVVWLFGFMGLVCVASMVLTVTDRLVPSYKPVNPKPFQFLSPYGFFGHKKQEVYDEYTVGPEPILTSNPTTEENDIIIGPQISHQEMLDKSTAEPIVGPAHPENNNQ